MHLCRTAGRRTVLATAILASLPSLSPAVTVINATWLGGTGLWSEPAHWSSNPYFPNNDDPAGTVYLAYVPSPASITLDSPVSVGGLTLSSSNATITQTADLTLVGRLSRTAGTYNLAGGTIFGNSPTVTGTISGSISVPTRANAAVVGANLNSASFNLAPSAQLTVTPLNSITPVSIGAYSLTIPGLPAKLVLLPPFGTATPQLTGGSLLANPNTALITQSPDNLPVTFTGGNSNGAVYLTPDTGSISLPNGLSSVNTVVKGGPNAITAASGVVGFKLTIEAGSVTSPTAPSSTITIGSRPDIGSVGMLVTSTPRPNAIAPTSTGILSYDPGLTNPTLTGAFTQPGQTYFSSAPGRAFTISADSFSPGSDNVYRFGGNGGWFRLSSPTNAPLLTGASSLVVGLPRSLFGEDAAPSSTYITLVGPNTYSGTTTVHANSRLEVGNSSPGLTSPSNVTVDGTLVLPSTLYYNYSGALSVRHGGKLEIGGNSPGSHDNFSDSIPVHLAGSTLAYLVGGTSSSSESVGTAYADAGLVSFNPETTQSGVISNLTLQTLSRSPGTTIHFDNSYFHNIGQPSSNKVFLGNSASLLVNGILPFATFPITTSSPQFLTYGANGVTGTNGTTVDINAASPTTNVTSATATLTGDRTINALRTYNASGTPNTINLAGHTLTLTSGCIITTSTATVSNGALTAASPELFLHTMRSPDGDLPLTISAHITDSPAGPVALVKDGTNTLELIPFSPNTYSGGTYVNEGTLRTFRPLPAGPVYLSDSTLDLRNPYAGTLMVPGTITASSSVLGTSTLNLSDPSPYGTFGGGELHVSALTVSPDSTLLLTRSEGHSLGIDDALDVRGAVLRASNGASLILRGPSYQDSAASALVNDPAAPARPSFRFATGTAVTVSAVTRGTRLSAEPSAATGAPTTLTYAGKLYSDNYDAELSATGNSRIIIDTAATLDTSRGFAGPAYDSHTLILSGTGTVEFAAGFTLMQVVNSKTLNDSGSALLHLTGPLTFVTNHTGNLPNYASSPPDLYAGSITLDSPGVTWQTRTNDQTYSQRLFVNAPATLDTQSSLTLSGPVVWSPAAALTKLGPGALSLPAAYHPVPTITVAAGSLTLPSLSTLATDSLTISPSATLTVGTAAVSPSDPAALTTFRHLLQDSKINRYTNDPTNRLGLAYGLVNSSLVARLTPFGDTNMNGTIDPDDFALIDRAYAQALPDPHWTDGDFDYNGVINYGDYLLLDTALYIQTHTLSPDFLSQRESQFGADYVSTLLTSIPEPSSLLAACGLALPLLTRRRRA